MGTYVVPPDLGSTYDFKYKYVLKSQVQYLKIVLKYNFSWKYLRCTAVHKIIEVLENFKY